jgi:asparagine synthase (glutamine-hydrolysing)
MCGIIFIKTHTQAEHSDAKCAARGPDSSKIIRYGAGLNEFYMQFFRLSIVGGARGEQPFFNGGIWSMCNGEIYNYKELEAKYKTAICTSDCEILAQLLPDHNAADILPQLNGEFAFVSHKTFENLVHFGTDRVGRKALYYSHAKDHLYVASSAAACQVTNTCDIVQCLPGVLYTLDLTNNILTTQRWHTFIFRPPRNSCEPARRLFIDAVRHRITQHDGTRPIGFFLSGGIDSSAVLTAALDLIYAARAARKPTSEQAEILRVIRFTPQVFTIGFFADAPDVLDAARMVDWLHAKYGKKSFTWHKVIKAVSDGLAAIPAVISALETYDTTTVRASVPMYMLSAYIRQQTAVRVVLSGEGSDELFGGYMYFLHLTNIYAKNAEILKLLNELYLFDALRADRSTAAHGLEVRTPFLDDKFVDEVLCMPRIGYNPAYQEGARGAMRGVVPLVGSLGMIPGLEYIHYPQDGLTKPALRMLLTGLLPDFMLYAKKEAFSDGVGHSWKSAIQNFCCEWAGQTPTELTPEQMYYESLFTLPKSLCVKLWLPNKQWIDTGAEPSATCLPCYADVKKS